MKHKKPQIVPAIRKTNRDGMMRLVKRETRFHMAYEQHWHNRTKPFQSDQKL